ncbi:ABC transporter permease [Rickettsia bellii]|uniref:Binding--dependent transport system inner membrane component family protein n=1 Tax=Rickettsia bellii str. RML An4 TaxID=1359193 RepID=A0A0F3QDT5_RICBE|nr:ABC transporter permease subunit [Rickettsia bellii]KJV89579.1 binding--dependent transport system inner membrane component family protein [Rickettsia bellii str. RML An4]
MFIAIIISLITAIIYGTIAAKYKTAENILIPILDIFQSVPILGFLTFTVTWFVSIFPNSSLGIECAVIFATFTNQVPNIAFSFYQSLKTIPNDLVEASNIFKLSPLKKFLKLELPFATQGLIWNSMMSMSGGWFFLVASETVVIGGNTISVPGIGSYIAKAIYEKDIISIIYSVITMFIVIILYDQIIFRPLIVWADKFRYENIVKACAPKSMVVDLFKKTNFITIYIAKIISIIFIPCNFFINNITKIISNLLSKLYIIFIKPIPNLLIAIIWYGCLACLAIYAANKCYDFVKTTISLSEFLLVIKLGFFTLLRVITMVILALIIWVPISVFIGLNSSYTEKMMPVIQIASAFPANFLFPFVVIFISHYNLNPNIALSFLMILGTQWYILFNVIAGTSAFPADLKESANIFRVKGWLWWKNIILPGIFPHIVTGVITAYGGAWNASIVAEIVSWGKMCVFLQLVLVCILQTPQMLVITAE